MSCTQPLPLRSRDFQAMLMQLSDTLSDQELEELIFYCIDDIGKKRAEEINRPHHLWQVLKERGLINEDNVSLLETMFGRIIKRDDLLKIVTDYKQAIPAGDRNSSVSQEFYEELEFVAENVNVLKWRRLMRTLGLTDADIDSLTERYRANIRDQIFNGLILWTSKFSEQASRRNLLEALEKSQLKLVADKLNERVLPV